PRNAHRDLAFVGADDRPTAGPGDRFGVGAGDAFERHRLGRFVFLVAVVAAADPTRGAGDRAGPAALDRDVKVVLRRRPAFDGDRVRNQRRVPVVGVLQPDLEGRFEGAAARVLVGRGGRRLRAAGFGDDLFAAVAEPPDQFAAERPPRPGG